MRRAGLLAAITAVALHVGFAAAQNPQSSARPPAAASRVPPTGIIAGQVVTATGAFVRAAQVRAHSDDGQDRLVTTGEDGRFELRQIPAGRWTLSATKAGFLTQRFGQRRPFGAATPIELSPGQRVNASFALTRAGAITGRVFDEFGEPIVGARVRALRSQMRDGRRYLQQVGPVDESDDLGAFRIYDLPGGEYYMSAARRIAPVDSADETTFAPTYYPGTATLQDALRVPLRPGEEQSASFQLLPVRMVPVQGVVLHADFSPASAYVSLVSSTPDRAITNIGATTDRDGRFVIMNATPGDFVLSATVRNDSGPAERGTLPVTIGAGGLGGVTMYTSRGTQLNFTVVADDGVTTPLPTLPFRLTAQSVPPDMPSIMMASTPPLRAGQQAPAIRATIPGLIGRVALRVDGLSQDWMVKSLTINDDVDATDTPFEFRGEPNASAKLVITNRVTEVAGAVTGEVPRTIDATVVVFADDEEKWAFPSRYIQWTKLDADGGFRLRALPPDTQYLAAAVDYLEESDVQDPAFLESLRMRATRFSLREGGAANLTLRMIQR